MIARRLDLVTAFVPWASDRTVQGFAPRGR
jgi:hypothetical protein